MGQNKSKQSDSKEVKAMSADQIIKNSGKRNLLEGRMMQITVYRKSR